MSSIPGYRGLEPPWTTPVLDLHRQQVRALDQLQRDLGGMRVDCAGWRIYPIEALSVQPDRRRTMQVDGQGDCSPSRQKPGGSRRQRRQTGEPRRRRSVPRRGRIDDIAPGSHLLPAGAVIWRFRDRSTRPAGEPSRSG